MHKVLTEEPRSGHKNPSKKYRQKIRPQDVLDHEEIDDFDSGKTFFSSERYRQYGADAKQFTDNLGPLLRYLAAQVGRRWDDVYSEIRNTLPKGNAAIDHVMTHVMQAVAVDTVQIGPDYDCKIYDLKDPNKWNNGEVTEGLYVDSKGILRYKEKIEKLYPPKEIKKIIFNDQLRFEKIDGIWYKIITHKYIDHVLDMYTGIIKPVERTWESKFQLAKKDLRKHHIKNDII